MASHSEITLQAVAVAIEDNPPYSVVDQYSADPAEFLALLASSTDHQPAEIRDTVQQLNVSGAALMIDFMSALARASGIPAADARLLLMRTDGQEVAEAALTAAGAPRQPQPLVLVQSTSDRDTSAMLLPKLVHERDWPVTEDLGLTHLGARGGTAIIEFLSWWMDPDVGATVVVVDQPHFVASERVPVRLTAVALRFGQGGPFTAVGWGEGPGPTEAEHSFGGPGACGGWPDLHAAVATGVMRPGDRVLVEAGRHDQTAWAMLRCTDAIVDCQSWWRRPAELV